MLYGEGELESWSLRPSPHTQPRSVSAGVRDRQRGEGVVEESRQAEGREEEGMCIGSLVCCKASSLCSGKTCVCCLCLPKYL